MPKEATLSILVTDITEKLMMKEMMIQTEKMMSIGGMAAGMAHEINNPLSAMLQSAQVLEGRLFTASTANVAAADKALCSFESLQTYLKERDIQKFLSGIRESGSRAAKIVSSMLEFSRKVESNRAPTKIDLLLDKAVELCLNDYDLKKKYDFRMVTIVREYGASVGYVPCTATQIEQVFVNLLKNAAQAMHRSSSASSKPAIILRTRRDDDFAIIEIEDNGPGMDHRTQSHVFEPFFTTKPSGEGTGLGLSVSKFLIVEKHSGSIVVESSVGTGTKFIIRLPL